jgi:hypothetical protein
MGTKDKEAVLTLYSRLMDELKQRSMLLGQLASGTLNFAIIPNFELCQLQIRLICEIFALACLTAHGDIPDVKSAMMQKEYNAEKIIGKLGRLHPNFSVLCMDDITEPFAAIARRDPTRTFRRRLPARRPAMSSFRFDPAELPP